VACAVPFAAGLMLVDVFLSEYPVLMLVVSCVIGAAILLPLYWRVAPADLRAQVINRLTGVLGQLRLARQVEG
jgi:hypothetical protein